MKKVMIFGNGGTIAMTEQDGVLKPAKSIKEILSMVPSLERMADISFSEFVNIDSTNVTPSHWNRLAQEIARIHDQVDAVIVTHGTDTMAYTATAISLALGRGLKIPVVFTGSQLPLASFGTDARFNLENSMKAVLRACEEKIAEVMIVFGDHAYRANRTIKTSESRFPAFDSPGFDPLARIDALGVHFTTTTLKADDRVPLEVKPDFQCDIMTIDLVPGIKPRMLRTFVDSEVCKGLLLKSLGAGNVPSEGEYSLLPVIQESVKADIPVVVSTKFIGGRTHMELYEPGKLAIQAGAIPVGDMTDVAAQVKLMWCLEQTKNMSTLAKMLLTDYVGEITT